MRVNEPVTQREYDYPNTDLLVSTTDAQGRITHCNHAFVEVSGYDYDELLNQPHNLIRHPDMPPEAFKDMWQTIGRGRPWTGVVKNRRRNGDHYWVRANVMPIVEGGKPVAYMSVRFKPTREEIKAAEALYAEVAAERASGRPSFKLHAGRVRPLGWADVLQRRHRLTLTHRVGLGLLFAASTGAGAAALSPQGWAAAVAAGLASAGAGAAVLAWFHATVQRPLAEIERFAVDLAACNLKSTIQVGHPHPLSSLARMLWQTQTNLRAVIGDAREEVHGTVESIAEIAKGSLDLSARTEAQAAALQQTAASMEELSGTVKQTADTSADVVRHSEQSATVASEGGRAVEAVGHTIQAINDSSRRVADIVQVIESIAFQTNILALNAAVEAARAGEQGRGFAVVASEVRALAQRSGTAAKEIRELIHASVEQVTDGTRRMDSASQTIGEAVSAVGHVSELIRMINHATTEQAMGISQVNSAVAELDKVTQANAALVEETAAVADQLRQRAGTLNRTVQVFRM